MQCEQSPKNNIHCASYTTACSEFLLLWSSSCLHFSLLNTICCDAAITAEPVAFASWTTVVRYRNSFVARSRRIRFSLRALDCDIAVQCTARQLHAGRPNGLLERLTQGASGTRPSQGMLNNPLSTYAELGQCNRPTTNCIVFGTACLCPVPRLPRSYRWYLQVEEPPTSPYRGVVHRSK